MKKIFIVVSILLSLHGFSQKIIQSEIDKFTKQKRIKTSDEWLKNRLVEGIAVYIRSVDTTAFINLNGYGPGADVIGSSDPAIFLLNNDSTVEVFPTGIQSYDIGSTYKTYSHQYYISISQIETLSRFDVKSVRKYGSDHYVDIEIPEKHQDQIKKLSLLFLAEYRK
jgi:hypothetical protein